VRICRNGCDSRLILCARLCGSGGCLRRAAPCWSRLRIRSRYPAIRATSARAAIRLTSRRVPLRGISRDAPLRPTSHRPIWGTSRRVLIAPKHFRNADHKSTTRLCCRLRKPRTSGRCSAGHAAATLSHIDRRAAIPERRFPPPWCGAGIIASATCSHLKK
jgi:hypothetical protein